MAKAPTSQHARDRGAFVLGQITASEYAECLAGAAKVTGSFFVRWRKSWRWDRKMVREFHRLPQIGGRK